MTAAKEYIEAVYQKVEKRGPHQKEFLQAVREFFNTIEPAIEKKSRVYKMEYSGTDG